MHSTSPGKECVSQSDIDVSKGTNTYQVAKRGSTVWKTQE